MANVKQEAIIRFKNKDFIEQFETTLMATGKVKVEGLGIFELRWIPARTGYNVGNGERIKIAGHYKLAFRATKRLKDAIQKHEN